MSALLKENKLTVHCKIITPGQTPSAEEGYVPLISSVIESYNMKFSNNFGLTSSDYQSFKVQFFTFNLKSFIHLFSQRDDILLFRVNKKNKLKTICYLPWFFLSRATIKAYFFPNGNHVLISGNVVVNILMVMPLQFIIIFFLKFFLVFFLSIFTAIAKLLYFVKKQS